MSSAADVDGLLREALVHHGAGRLAEAEELYARARAFRPSHFDVLHLSGTVALQQGRFADAVTLLTQALHLNARTGVCAYRLALAESSLGRPVEAEAHLRLALRRQPDLAEVWECLGSVLAAQGRFAEVVPCHERSVALKPGNADGWYNLGLALQFVGRNTESLAAFDRALRLAPERAAPHYGRALALLQSYRTTEAVAAFDEALTRDPAHLNARSYRLKTLNYLPGIPPAQLFAEHQAYGAVFPEAAAWLPSPAEAAGRRLRIAFLSPDFRTHSVAYFIEPLIRHLDRSRFEIFLYHDHFITDEVSARLQAQASVWRNFAGLSHDAVAARIRGDAPDILVDLAGHTTMNRLPVFARRAAPVQVSYLGYPNTTGLATMDFRLTDDVADPSGRADEWHTEELVRFAPTAWAYQPPASCPPPASASPCVANGFVTFGCFNNFSKVTDEAFAAWGQLLRTVPNARLRLKTPGLDDPAIAAIVREKLQRLGVADDRLELLDRTPGVGAHLALYQGVDIALDTSPYNGTTTTCEALWMGVPVITLAGAHHASRVGASLLQAVGHPEWIARDWNSYVSLAADLAGRPAELTAIHGKLRADFSRSALADHAGQANRFGNALLECWRTRCRNVPAVAVA